MFRINDICAQTISSKILTPPLPTNIKKIPFGPDMQKAQILACDDHHIFIEYPFRDNSDHINQIIAKFITVILFYHII